MEIWQTYENGRIKKILVKNEEYLMHENINTSE